MIKKTSSAANCRKFVFIDVDAPETIADNEGWTMMSVQTVYLSTL